MFVAQYLAEAGRFGGDIQKILDTDGSIILDTYYYVSFVNRYRNVEMELNKCHQ